MYSKIQRRLKGLFTSTNRFSQSGEDNMLIPLFADKILNDKTGFYVDVGSFHPYKHSNTYLCYLHGWRGINIDPRPGSAKLFDRLRPRDTNLEFGIDEEEGVLDYYFLSKNSPMNTFSKENLERLGLEDSVKKVIPVSVKTLANTLDHYMPPDVDIDFLSIDVEGFEMKVLRSNDWSKYEPKVIMVETNCMTLSDVLKSEVNTLLDKKGYLAVGKSIILRDVASLIFVHEDHQY